MELFTHKIDLSNNFDAEIIVGKLSETPEQVYITTTFKDNKNMHTAIRAKMTKDELTKIRNRINRVINLL